MPSTAYRVINTAPVPAAPQGHIGSLSQDLFRIVFREIIDFPTAVVALTLASPYLMWKNLGQLPLDICHISPHEEYFLRDRLWWKEWEALHRAKEREAEVVAAAKEDEEE